MNYQSVQKLFALALGLAALRCADDGASPDPGEGLGAGGAVGFGSGGAIPGGGGAIPGGGGAIPGGGGAIPGGGGAIPGGGGAIPGGGGAIPGGGGAIPGGGGAPGVVDPVGNANRNPGFINLAEPAGQPLPATGQVLTPPAPTGWQYHAIDGTVCRDGSPLGIYVHTGTVSKLMIYFEGGGACSNTQFCRFNPKNTNEVLAGNGETLLESAGGAVAGRQQPGISNVPLQTLPFGILDATNAANPVKDWSMVYIPYCSGDVHFGTRTNVVVPSKPAVAPDPRDIPQQQFRGASNTRKIIARVFPTFQSATQVLVAGVSAGSFGAALNFSMIQDTFGNTPATALLDSGLPFDDQFMPACMQKRWRENWGLDFPADCTECQQADGGGLLGMADFLLRKHPNGKIGLITSMEDQVIRLFFAVGNNTCATYETADPFEIGLDFVLNPASTLMMAAPSYVGGLNALRTKYQATGRLATFYIPGNLHQHYFRPRFFTETRGGKTMAQFAADFVNGTMQQVGP